MLMSPARNRARKLPFTLELIEIDGVWVGINPQRANSIVALLLRGGHLTELAGYRELDSEVAIGGSRLDFRLRGPDETPACYLEVKQASYRSGDDALFPDARSVRALRHLEELGHCRARGARAVIVFVISREDCLCLRPADSVDPDYGLALRRVCADGVEALSYRLSFSSGGVRDVERIAVRL